MNETNPLSELEGELGFLRSEKTRLEYALAESENSLKRREKTAEDRADKKVQEVLLACAGALDDLERVILALSEDDSEHVSGAVLTYKKFLGELRKFGFKKIPTVSEKFDPDLHEAVSAEECDEEPGTILSCVQNGYVRNNKLLRAAKVRVAK